MLRTHTTANMYGRRIASTLTLAGLLALARPALGQRNDFAQSADQRAKQYEELAVESEHLQQQANVLRKLVRLVKPTVVHIDSKHNDSESRYARREIEEAGSGTIIQYKDKYYVLTNRHVVRGANSE